jgi:hypothetical protein
MRVARWYCPQAQETFSLLPDCLAARLGGSLDEVESAVVAAETVGVEAAAQALRIEQSDLPGAVRWLRRRRRGVGAAVLALITAMPGGPLGAVPEFGAVRQVLGTERALVALRGIAAERLHALPPPLGFRPLRRARPERDMPCQHETGPDPPRSRRYLSLAGNEAGERRR